MDFNESQTKENLARVFAGLCQDGARYQFISKRALSEGYASIANFLTELASKKMAHASCVYSILLENINGNYDNIVIEAGFPFEVERLKTSLESSYEIEENEGKNILPHFAKIAQDEGFKDIQKLLTLISEVEIDCSIKLKDLSQKFDNKSLYSSSSDRLYKCSNCGHSETKRLAWKNCPLCGYPQGYVEIDNEN